MSMLAIIGATKDVVQAMLGLTPGEAADAVCDVTMEGQPKPYGGQIFYGIIGTGFTNSASLSRDDAHDLEIVITLRADYCPNDRVGTELLTQKKTTANTGGLWARVYELAAGLHMNYAVLDKAGGSYGGGTWTGGQPYSLPNTVNGFEQPWRFARTTLLGAKGPDWFWSEDHENVITGVAAKLSFDFVRRIQTIESQS